MAFLPPLVVARCREGWRGSVVVREASPEGQPPLVAFGGHSASLLSWDPSRGLQTALLARRQAFGFRRAAEEQ